MRSLYISGGGHSSDAKAHIWGSKEMLFYAKIFTTLTHFLMGRIAFSNFVDFFWRGVNSLISMSNLSLISKIFGENFIGKPFSV
jgi:hypothetical protein